MILLLENDSKDSDKSLLIPFPDRYETRREAADSVDARQGEVTKCRIDMEMQ